jgi:hypothetical protein
MSLSAQEINEVENFKMQRYLNSVYLSLGRPIEITLKDGRVADGIFGGFDFNRCVFRVRNFCFYGDRRIDRERTLDLADVKYFTVKEISIRRTTSAKPSEPKGERKPQSSAKGKRREQIEGTPKNEQKNVFMEESRTVGMHEENNSMVSFSNKKHLERNQRTGNKNGVRSTMTEKEADDRKSGVRDLAIDEGLNIARTTSSIAHTKIFEPHSDFLGFEELHDIRERVHSGPHQTPGSNNKSRKAPRDQLSTPTEVNPLNLNIDSTKKSWGDFNDQKRFSEQLHIENKSSVRSIKDRNIELKNHEAQVSNAEQKQKEHSRFEFEIRDKPLKKKVKEFKKFEVTANPALHLTLEADDKAQFDQFALNKQQFGVGADFNENEYTTELVLSEFSEHQIREAELKAQEILRGTDLPLESRHVMEERGLRPLQDYENEEELYSAVQREEQHTDPPQPAQSSFKFKVRVTEGVKAKETSFVNSILVNWKKKMRKTSELIESISVSSDQHPPSTGFQARGMDQPKNFHTLFPEASINLPQPPVFANPYYSMSRMQVS